MANTLAIRLGSTPGQLEWVRLDPDGRQLGGVERDGQGLGALARDHRVVVLVPAIHVIVTEVDVPPTKSAARQRQMVPFALEETLAQDLDELFFAVGRRRPGERIAVAVTARERIDAWLAELRALEIAPAAMYAETEGVPDTPGALTLVAEHQRMLGRAAGAAPFVLEGCDLEQALTLLRVAGEELAEQQVLLYADREAAARLEPSFATVRARLASFEARRLEDGVLPRLAAVLHEQPGTNLLQGPYAPRSNWSEALWPWRKVAALIVSWVVLATATQAATYFNLQRQERALSEQVEQTCREAFASAGLAECRSEVQRRLAAAGANTGDGARSFLETLQLLAEHRNPASAITALSFRNGTMDLRLLAPSVPALDEFVQRLGQSGLEARIQSVNPGEEGVESQLQIVGQNQ